jgi:hypothetical protein
MRLDTWLEFHVFCIFLRVYINEGNMKTKFILLATDRMIIALIMEAASTSETSVNFYQNTRRYNPDDSHLQ